MSPHSELYLLANHCILEPVKLQSLLNTKYSCLMKAFQIKAQSFAAFLFCYPVTFMPYYGLEEIMVIIHTHSRLIDSCWSWKLSKGCVCN